MKVFNLRKASLVLMAGIIAICLFTYYGSANSDLQVNINGKSCSFTPPALIVNDRVMVPVRFIIEDSAIRGNIRWDQNTMSVIINANRKKIEMTAGSKQLKVNGQYHSSLESPPFIHMDRIYVPIRSVIEALGGQVTWNNAGREVTVRINTKPEVFAYYYYRSFEELKANIDLFSTIAFRWFQTNGKGELSYEYQDSYAEILSYCRSKGVEIQASVVLMGAEPLNSLLCNSQNRSRLIGNLVDEVKRNQYNGVNIDFELMDPKDAGNFTLFLKELKTSLGSDYQLSAAVFARTGNERWPTPYEYAEIGQIVDRVVVMAYDYSYITSPPRPVAPLWWVKQVVAFMADNIPKEKVLLGMPTYGYDWNSAGTASTVTLPKMLDLKRQYELREYFDNYSMSPYFTYVDSSNNSHQIWMENARSLKEKYDLALTSGIAGISFWRIGNGFSDLYNILETKPK